MNETPPAYRFKPWPERQLRHKLARITAELENAIKYLPPETQLRARKEAADARRMIKFYKEH